MNINTKNISRIKDEANLVRDNFSNALLFTNNDPLSKRNSFFKEMKSDINMLKQEIILIRESLNEVRNFLENTRGREEQ